LTNALGALLGTDCPPHRHFYLARQAERERRRRQAQERAAVPDPNRVPTVEEIADVSNLLRVFNDLKRQGGKAPGLDRVTYDDLSIPEASSILRKVSRAILGGKYLPQPTRPVNIRKPSGGHRTLQLGSIADRTVATALHEALQERLERVYLPQSHGFRRQRGTWTLLADLEQLVTATNRKVLVNVDIEKAFDNILIQPLLEHFGEIITDSKVLSLVETVIRGHNTRRNKGINQGCPFSPAALNVLLTLAHDRPMSEIHLSPCWRRYADNCIYTCQDVLEGNRMYSTATALLNELEMSFKGSNEGRNIIDLNEGQTAELLGYIVSLKDHAVQFDLHDNIFQILEEKLLGAHETDDPPETARLIIMGSLEHFGPAFKTDRSPCVLKRIQKTADRLGFRKVTTIQEMRQKWNDSWERWKQCRIRASNSL
jgi:retron-type reverse transcriptase